jgi:hypothetical protein
VSAVNGAGVAALLEAISRRLVLVAPPAGTAVPVSARQVECLRRADREFTVGDHDAARDWLWQCLTGRDKSALP